MSITLWKPEPDLVLHQALGKLAEECAELSQALARCLIQGYREEEPVTHNLNRTQLMEEIADVKAAMRWLFDVLDQPFAGESPRERRKFDGFREWQSKLEDNMAARSPSDQVLPVAWRTETTARQSSHITENGKIAEQWALNGFEVTPLYAHPSTTIDHVLKWSLNKSSEWVAVTDKGLYTIRCDLPGHMLFTPTCAGTPRRYRGRTEAQYAAQADYDTPAPSDHVPVTTTEVSADV